MQYCKDSVGNPIVDVYACFPERLSSNSTIAKNFTLRLAGCTMARAIPVHVGYDQSTVSYACLSRDSHGNYKAPAMLYPLFKALLRCAYSLVWSAITTIMVDCHLINLAGTPTGSVVTAGRSSSCSFIRGCVKC